MRVCGAHYTGCGVRVCASQSVVSQRVIVCVFVMVCVCVTVCVSVLCHPCSVYVSDGKQHASLKTKKLELPR